jgi:hypothetical protein
MGDRPWWCEIADAEQHRDLTPEEDALAMRAYSGLLQGNLEPLAEYLRTGAPFDFIFRREIVEAIEGGREFRLELRKQTTGPGNVVTRLQTQWRDMQIGLYIQKRLPNLNNQLEAAVADAMEHFGAKRGVVLNAWSKFKTSRWFQSANDDE